jgi:membrane protease YdiL (CAAX protease family)
LVIEDPDRPAMQETETIGVFEPGTFIESQVEWNLLTKVFLYTLGSYLLSIVATIIIMIPLLGLGLVDLFATTPEGLFKPWAMLILTFSSLTFLAGPLYYVKKYGLNSKSIGIRDFSKPLNYALGLIFGAAMLGGNILFSWLITDFFQIPVQEDITLIAADIYELVAWIIVMFVIVGFTEEVLFRGFLQRRMEMYFKGRGDGSNAPLKALLITSFIFGVIHLDIIGLATRFMLGMFLGYLAQKTNYSVVGPTIAHGLNNAIVVILLYI